jgi:CRP-like cAMP-binding protein
MNSKDIERRFRSGEVIVERGSPGRELYVVREGTVLLEEAPALATRLLAPGDVFGECAPLLGRPHSIRACAEGDVVVLGLDVPALNRLFERSPEFAVRLARLLAQRAERALSPLGQTGAAVAIQHEPSATAPPAPIEESERGFAAALLRCCAPGDETPLAVQGRLADLAREAGLDVRDAYACLQRLLDRHVLRLVDDQLSILDLDAVRSRCS